MTVDACHLAPPWAVATPSRIGGGNDIWEVCSWENPPMPSDDDFRTLEEAVSAELHRLIAATELALRHAVTGAASDEERWGAVAGALTGISNVVIGLARSVDRLDRRYPGSSG